jgi:hypothetical protein
MEEIIRLTRSQKARPGPGAAGIRQPAAAHLRAIRTFELVGYWRMVYVPENDVVFDGAPATEIVLRIFLHTRILT